MAFNFEGFSFLTKPTTPKTRSSSGGTGGRTADYDMRFNIQKRFEKEKDAEGNPVPKLNKAGQQLREMQFIFPQKFIKENQFSNVQEGTVGEGENKKPKFTEFATTYGMAALVNGSDIMLVKIPETSDNVIGFKPATKGEDPSRKRNLFSDQALYDNMKKAGFLTETDEQVDFYLEQLTNEDGTPAVDTAQNIFGAWKIVKITDENRRKVEKPAAETAGEPAVTAVAPGQSPETAPVDEAAPVADSDDEDGFVDPDKL